MECDLIDGFIHGQRAPSDAARELNELGQPPAKHGPLDSPRNGTERQYDFNSRGLETVDEGRGDSVVRWWAKDRVIDTEIGFKPWFCTQWRVRVRRTRATSVGEGFKEGFVGLGFKESSG